jgi:endonuclease YncB( thermonuclease family)
MGMRLVAMALGSALQLIAMLPASAQQTARALDGDTFVLDGEMFRVAGIDAPDSRNPRCETELALGKKAKARLGQLLELGSIRVVRQRHDHQGRTIAHTTADGIDVAAVMLAERFALDDEPGREAELARVRNWCGRTAALEDSFEAVPLPRPRPSTP